MNKIRKFLKTIMIGLLIISSLLLIMYYNDVICFADRSDNAVTYRFQIKERIFKNGNRSGDFYGLVVENREGKRIILRLSKEVYEKSKTNFFVHVYKRGKNSYCSRHFKFPGELTKEQRKAHGYIFNID